MLVFSGMLIAVARVLRGVLPVGGMFTGVLVIDTSRISRCFCGFFLGLVFRLWSFTAR